MLAPPPVELHIQPGDAIAVAGTEEQLREVERACGRRAAEAPEPG
jgi:Trk K+ transport system NAD-binding subunit